MMTVSRDDKVSPEIEAALFERDGRRCCVNGFETDVKPTYIIAPSIVDDEAIQPGVCLHLCRSL